MTSRYHSPRFSDATTQVLLYSKVVGGSAFLALRLLGRPMNLSAVSQAVEIQMKFAVRLLSCGRKGIPEFVSFLLNLGIAGSEWSGSDRGVLLGY